MKKIFSIMMLCLGGFSGAIFGQFSLQVLAISGGEFATSNSLSVQQTIGESIIGFGNTAQNDLSQGFQQGLLVKCQSLKYSASAQMTVPAYDSCQNMIELKGNSFRNTSGEWTDASGLYLGSDTTAQLDLNLGENRFFWTLSETQCPNYDSNDSLIVRGLQANANDDSPLLYMEMQPHAIEVIGNDSDLETDYTWKVVGQIPTDFGISYSQDSLTWLFATSGTFEGTMPIKYILANSGYCKKADTATVFMRIQPLYGEGFSDGITPNGDGFNETFILCDSSVCHIEMRIYNRWGAEVFADKNYANDWNGNNQKGAPLPAGTYYYHAFVNGSERRGSVTVLR